MVLPLVLIMILPKMMNDPETKKEMEQFQMPKYEMPEVSELITSFFSGGETKTQPKKSVKAAKKRQWGSQTLHTSESVIFARTYLIIHLYLNFVVLYQ